MIVNFIPAKGISPLQQVNFTVKLAGTGGGALGDRNIGMERPCLVPSTTVGTIVAVPTCPLRLYYYNANALAAHRYCVTVCVKTNLSKTRLTSICHSLSAEKTRKGIQFSTSSILNTRREAWTARGKLWQRHAWAWPIKTRRKRVASNSSHRRSNYDTINYILELYLIQKRSSWPPIPTASASRLPMKTKPSASFSV